MTRKHLWYGLTATVGMGATTIASAQVGDPLPVVVPALVAGGSIAAHHIMERRDEPAGELDLADPTDGQDLGDDLEDIDLDLDGRRVVVIEEGA